MKKRNKYLNFGVCFYVIFLVTNQFNLAPEFIKGLCVGLGLFLMIIGGYSENHDISKIKSFKKIFIKKLINIK